MNNEEVRNASEAVNYITSNTGFGGGAQRIARPPIISSAFSSDKTDASETYGPEVSSHSTLWEQGFVLPVAPPSALIGCHGKTAFIVVRVTADGSIPEGIDFDYFGGDEGRPIPGIIVTSVQPVGVYTEAGVIVGCELHSISIMEEGLNVSHLLHDHY